MQQLCSSELCNSQHAAAGGVGHLPFSSPAGSITRINGNSEVRQSAQPSTDAEGESLTLSRTLSAGVMFWRLPHFMTAAE